VWVDASLLEVSNLSLELLLASCAPGGQHTTQIMTLEPPQIIGEFQQAGFVGVALLEYGLHRVTFKINSGGEVTYGQLRGGLGRRAHVTAIQWSGERPAPLDARFAATPAVLQTAVSRPQPVSSGAIGAAAARDHATREQAGRQSVADGAEADALLEIFERIAALYIGAGAAGNAAHHLRATHGADAARLRNEIEGRTCAFGRSALAALARDLGLLETGSLR
jgi:hypothetical protein